MGNPLRDLLGITALERRTSRLEKNMATAKEQIVEVRAAFTDFVADVDARLDQLLAAQGTLSPEAQVEFDALKQAIADADSRIGDADGSDTPPPADGGDEGVRPQF